MTKVNPLFVYESLKTFICSVIWIDKDLSKWTQNCWSILTVWTIQKYILLMILNNFWDQDRAFDDAINTDKPFRFFNSWKKLALLFGTIKIGYLPYFFVALCNLLKLTEIVVYHFRIRVVYWRFITQLLRFFLRWWSWTEYNELILTLISTSNLLDICFIIKAPFSQNMLERLRASPNWGLTFIMIISKNWKSPICASRRWSKYLFI